MSSPLARIRTLVPIVWLAVVAVLLIGGCSAGLGTGAGPGGPVAVDPDAAGQQGGNVTVAQNAQPGIGGTGKTPGIGGTGDVAGTPGIGGTGIIGTVTGFGSILVNGFEVDYAPGIPISFKDRTMRANGLRVGQVVEVEAEGSGSRLQARRIAVRHEVAGPIERIDHARRVAVVFGQRVEIAPGVVSTGGNARKLSVNDLRAGDHIDVSGLRRANGVIAASRIEKTGPGAAAVLRGRVMSSGPDGFTVNGVRIDAPLSSRPARLVSGQDVQIVGTAVGGRLSARRINPVPARPFAGRVRNLSVEGYVTRAVSGGVAVGQVPITRLPARARIRAGDRVILDGPVDARGRFAPSRVRAPQVNLDFPGEPSTGLPRQTRPPPGRRVLPPPPVIRGPEPRSRIYGPPSRSRGR